MISYEDNTQNLEIDQSNYSNEQPLEIKTTLLKTEHTRRIGNRIIEESKIY
jgi:hypothetical protein